MISSPKPRGWMPSRFLAGAAILALGLMSTACTTPQSDATQNPGTTSQDPGMPPEPTSSATPSAGPPSKLASSATPIDAQETTLRLTVSGEATTAMVKALVITRNGKEQGGQMIRQNLPFSQELVLPAGSELTKVLVLGKNIDGASTELTCSIDIAGEIVEKSSSRGHAPAECLFLGAGNNK